MTDQLTIHRCHRCERTLSTAQAFDHDAQGHDTETIVLRRERRRGQKGPEQKWATAWTPEEPRP